MSLHPFLRGLVAAIFFLNTALPVSLARAEDIFSLPAPGTMVPMTPRFQPAIVMGINIHPDNPLRFDFVIDKGDSGLEGKEFEKESTKLIKYFLASLTVPANQMWVNLSPYEKDRIIPQVFGGTEMGRDLLAEDYLLKQLTSTLVSPQDKLGAEFWQRVYARAKERLGTTDIPVDSFNKVWIVPEEALIYEHENGAFIVESHLKVMTEEDYLALRMQREGDQGGLGQVPTAASEAISKVSKEVMREIVIPEIEKEVNEGKTFADLRQMYHSALLANWYKKTLQDSLLGQEYADQMKTGGVEVADKTISRKIYAQYVEAFKKGVYNFIKEEVDPTTQEVIPRKYFSGGARMDTTYRTTRDSKVAVGKAEGIKKGAVVTWDGAGVRGGTAEAAMTVWDNRKKLGIGTSGWRDDVRHLTDRELFLNMGGFVNFERKMDGLKPGEPLVVGRDLRRSSPRLAKIVMAGVVAAGQTVLDAGDVPSPALFYYATQNGLASLETTASHNPAGKPVTSEQFVAMGLDGNKVMQALIGNRILTRIGERYYVEDGFLSLNEGFKTAVSELGYGLEQFRAIEEFLRDSQGQNGVKPNKKHDELLKPDEKPMFDEIAAMRATEDALSPEESRFRSEDHMLKQPVDISGSVRDVHDEVVALYVNRYNVFRPISQGQIDQLGVETVQTLVANGWIKEETIPVENKPAQIARHLSADLKAARRKMIDVFGEADFNSRILPVLEQSLPLKGKKYVVYQHSSVGRDILVTILENMGAEIIPVYRLPDGEFEAIDTENVTPANKAFFKRIGQENPGVDGGISVDGDADRPFLLDENFVFHRGDVLGIPAARFLGTDFVTVPDSANDAVDVHLASAGIALERGEVGSPYMVFGMKEAVGRGKKRAVFWEVNGGLGTGTDIVLPGGTLKALPSRDAVLPILTALFTAARQNQKLSEVFREIETRFTGGGMKKDFSLAISSTILRKFSPAVNDERRPDFKKSDSVRQVEFLSDGSIKVTLFNGSARTLPLDAPEASEFLKIRALAKEFYTAEDGFVEPTSIRYVTGVRIQFGKDVVQMRYSKNKPTEFRVYTNADTQARADELADGIVLKAGGAYDKMRGDPRFNDSAMTGDELRSQAENGGIDLDAAMGNMRIQKSGQGVKAFGPDMMNTFSIDQGLVPVIINVTPFDLNNMPSMLKSGFSGGAGLRYAPRMDDDEA